MRNSSPSEQTGWLLAPAPFRIKLRTANERTVARLEHFLCQLEALRAVCQQLPPDFGRDKTEPERQAARNIIGQVELALKNAKLMLMGM